MNKSEKIYSISEKPFVYRLSQNILAPFAEKNIKKKIELILAMLPKKQKHLDVGCGPKSYLFSFGIKPTGIDISENYVREYMKNGAKAYVSSAEKLWFSNSSFDIVWSLGLLHHLSDHVAKKAIKEMLRVCKNNGYVVIFDAVMPVNFIKRPLAWFLRRFDRGRFVREENELKKIFPEKEKWNFSRHTYTITGLELLLAVYRKK